jgi:tetratricopeptide (TPR) repeat protein
MSAACPYCGFENEDDAAACARCGAVLGAVEADEDELAALGVDEVPCPSCGSINTSSAEYCTSCGTPMAVITRVIELSSANQRGPLETWRVFGIETRMVARDAELARLDALHTQCVSSQSCTFAAVVSGTGLGKSRLFAELRRALDASFSSSVVAQAECRVITTAPFAVIGRLLRERFYIAEDEPHAIASRKFGEAIRSILRDDESARRVARLVGHMIGLDSSHEDDEPLPDDHNRSFEALAELLRADAARDPMILIVEDLQYASAQTIRLLTYLRRALAGSPILVLLSWNPDEVIEGSELSTLETDETLRLNNLTDDQVDAFVRQTLYKANEVPKVLVDKIVESAHGNPLAVEEMLRLLISEGTVDTRQAEWRVHASRVKKVKLPQTVEAAVRARLHALNVEERALLGMAACVGDSFWPRLLVCLGRLASERDRQAGDGPDDAARVEAILESLERKDMVRRRDASTISGETELFFKHRIERKALYAGLDSGERQRYHRLTAQWLARASERDALDLDEAIAEHFDRARCLDHAAHWYLRAARVARARYANRKAITLFTKGLSYLSDADMNLKIAAFHDLGSVYDALGEFDQALAYYRELLRFAWLLDDGAKAGVAHNKIGRALRALGEFDDALDSLQRSLVLFQGAHDLKGVASTLDDIGKIHWIRSDYADAMPRYMAALQLRRELGDKRSIALSLNHIGSLHLQRGEFREAMTYFREALDLRREVDDRQGVAESFNNLGILCLERADYAQAATLFEEAREIIVEIGYRAMEGFALNNLGEARLLMGEVDAASDLLERALEIAEESGEPRLVFDILRNLGQTALKQGDRDGAIEQIEEALEIAEELDSGALLGAGHQSMADVHAHFVFDAEFAQESVELAEVHYQIAAQTLSEVGNAAQLGKCLTAFGHFLLEQGDLVRGRQQLELAQDIFDRLQMHKLWEANDALMQTL